MPSQAAHWFTDLCVDIEEGPVACYPNHFARQFLRDEGSPRFKRVTPLMRASPSE